MTDKELEIKLKKVYSRANKEVLDKANTYFGKFDAQDKVKRKQLEKGVLSENDYLLWRKRKMIRGREYANFLSELTAEYINADETAYRLINKELPLRYLNGYNAVGKIAEDAIAGYKWEYLFDNEALYSLLKEDGDIHISSVTLDRTTARRYTEKKARAEILQGIVQGESVNDVARRLEKVSITEARYTQLTARTLMNGARNEGTLQGQKRCINDGILLKKQWQATHDSRTRDSHTDMDGEIQDVDKPFSNGLMRPQDPSGRPEEVYNCRCDLTSSINGFYNKYTGKLILVKDNRAENYKMQSQEYWRKYYAEKDKAV